MIEATQALKNRLTIRKQRRFKRRASESMQTEPRATILIFRTKKFGAPHPNDGEAMLMLSMEAVEDEW